MELAARPLHIPHRKAPGAGRKFISFFRENQEKNIDFFGKTVIIKYRMDMMNKKALPDPAGLEDLKSHPRVVGVRQLRKALRAGAARLVFLARNADPSVTEPLEQACLESGVRCTWVSDMAALGRACGIDVGTAAAAVVSDPLVLPGKPEE